jgi:hypothetical protein
VALGGPHGVILNMLIDGSYGLGSHNMGIRGELQYLLVDNVIHMTGHWIHISVRSVHVDMQFASWPGVKLAARISKSFWTPPPMLFRLVP